MIVSRVSLPWKCSWLAIVAMGRCKVLPLLSFSMEVLRLLSNPQCNDWNVRQSCENTCPYFTLYHSRRAQFVDWRRNLRPRA